MLNTNLKRILRSRTKTAILSLTLMLACHSFAAPPPPPPPPHVNVFTGDPGDPDPGDTNTCGVTAGIENPPQAAAEATLVGHWSWSVGQVTVTPYDGGPDITTNTGNFHVDLVPISDPGQPDDGKIDDTNPAAKFTGTFFLSGYYAIPVTASVHFVDSVTGADAGTYSNTDYVGDSMDNPAYDPTQDYSGTTSPNSAALPVTGNWPTSTVSASPYGTIVPPPPPPLPSKRVASGILAGLPHPIKLGLYSKYHFTEKYTVAVQPKFKVGDVSFAIPSGVASMTATPEMATSTKGQQVQTGNVILVLTAKLPSQNPTGELMIATRISTNKAIGSAKVLVLEPRSLDQATFEGDIVGKNILVNASTSPFDSSVIAPKVRLEVSYSTSLIMRVRDQFTHNLDPIFAGTAVFETFTGNAIPYDMNSPISADGTYADPTGAGLLSPVIEDNKDTPTATWFVAQTNPQAYPTDLPKTVITKISVSVGGRLLSPDPAVSRSVIMSYVVPASKTTIHIKITSP